MPISWKKNTKFKPELMLSRFEKYRTITADGGASFTGFEIYEHASVLHSMLIFPDSADDTDKTSLIWRALSKSRPDLSPSNFLDAINKTLTASLSKREEKFHLIASISFNNKDWPKTISVQGVKLTFLGQNLPKKYRSRIPLVDRYARLGQLSSDPKNYCLVCAEVMAKSPDSGASKALRSIDLIRSLWCLQANSGMQVSFGGNDFKPINVIRLGNAHTLHKPSGTVASDGVWYDPAYSEAKPYGFKNSTVSIKNTKYALRKIKLAKFGNQITESLVRYVRALDEPDPNTAFLKLWSALERLVTPGVADYDRLVSRCSFLFQDSEYNSQVLQHLREYRNKSVHAGEGAGQARTNCFLLQGYYRELVWFLLRNSQYFVSIAEVNEFLDQPADKRSLKRKRQLITKALGFIS